MIGGAAVDPVAWTRTLHSHRNSDGGWPYSRGRRSRLEPTCWALMAVGAAVEETPLPTWARADGLLVEPDTGEVNYAFNGVAALAMSARRPDAHVLTRRLVVALVASRGVAVPPSPSIEINTSLQGWSWTPGTFTWVEPTAWCLLALKRWPGDSEATAARVRDGEAVLQDRVCADGGWNYGNGKVNGQMLPAHVPPTAAGVLALQDRADTALVREAISFVERSAIREASTTALALAALALMALGRPIEAVIGRLGERQASAEAFGNVAALAMATLALTAAATGERPFALAPRGGV